MARIKAISLFLVFVLVLGILLAALAAAETQPGLVITITQESSNTLAFGVAAPTASSVILASNCDGCSGGGSGG